MDNIVYGVTMAIEAYFGDDIKIYEDTVKQGFSKPCFIVLPEKSEMKSMSIGRFLKTQTIKVIYYPDSLKERNEMEETAFRLSAALRKIKWQGDSYAGKNMRWEEDNEKLTFRAEFETVLYWDPSMDHADEDEDDSDLMRIMNYGENVDN
ncbi:MAG: hypothetical protein IKD83_02995 [Firmicutes bacterium]|nr:hypothetical protein [Bacillota bacterium]